MRRKHTHPLLPASYSHWLEVIDCVVDVDGSCAAGVSQSAAAGLRRPRCPHHASEALPHATHVHHGVAALLQTGGPLPHPLSAASHVTLALSTTL